MRRGPRARPPARPPRRGLSPRRGRSKSSRWPPPLPCRARGRANPGRAGPGVEWRWAGWGRRRGARVSSVCSPTSRSQQNARGARRAGEGVPGGSEGAAQSGLPRASSTVARRPPARIGRLNATGPPRPGRGAAGRRGGATGSADCWARAPGGRSRWQPSWQGARPRPRRVVGGRRCRVATALQSLSASASHRSGCGLRVQGGGCLACGPSARPAAPPPPWLRPPPRAGGRAPRCPACHRGAGCVLRLGRGRGARRPGRAGWSDAPAGGGSGDAACLSAGRVPAAARTPRRPRFPPHPTPPPKTAAFASSDPSRSRRSPPPVPGPASSAHRCGRAPWAPQARQPAACGAPAVRGRWGGCAGRAPRARGPPRGRGRVLHGRPPPMATAGCAVGRAGAGRAPPPPPPAAARRGLHAAACPPRPARRCRFAPTHPRPLVLLHPARATSRTRARRPRSRPTPPTC
jgi:hypothetical protein